MKRVLNFCLFTCFFSMSSYSQISGVVTYYFNKYQGDKADIGSKVYLIPETEITDDEFKMVDSFELAKVYITLIESTTTLNSMYVEEVKKYEGKKRYKDLYEAAVKMSESSSKELEEYQKNSRKNGISNSEDFEKMDLRVMRFLLRIQEKSILTKTVDGNGNYSLEPDTGNYYVLIISRNRTGLHLSNIMGKYHITKIAYKKDDRIDVSYRFDLN